MNNNHVIFIHPDGTSPSHYGFARFVDHGPDGHLNWDKLSHAGVYLGHMEDQLGGTSNGGAVTHATGAKVYAESFGLEEGNTPIVPLSGNVGKTIMQEAVEANKVTALVQSGAIYEPGTAAFVAQVGEIEVDGQRIPPRQRLADIAKQVIESGVDFIMGGGELNLLPIGTDGFHGTAAELDALSTNPLRRPTENLIELAESLGYTVVYTEEQLYELLDPATYPTPPTKVLGVFAPIHTFNDRPEEVLAERGLPLYVETAPTVAEMLEVTQKLAESHPNFQNGSFTVVEEEGSDNFGNNNNAAGTLEGTRRGDAAIGVALEFYEKYENSLIITAADSDAGGLQVRDPRNPDQTVGTINNNPTTESRPVPLDGQTGADTDPFVAAPDVDGDVFNFGIAWAGTPDFSGSIVAKAHGVNADKLPATVDNTGIYELMYETLFEVELEARNSAPTPAPTPTKNTGNVIFIHPDGTSPSHYMALRNIDHGPDGRLNWDNMTNAGVYLGHMEDQLTGTSNAGAVTHANGVKVFNESFGLNGDNSQVTPASGKRGMTILEEAIAAGKATALIQSGHLAEPGSAAFAAKTTNRDGDNIRARDKYAEIIEQVIRSGTNVIMGGGELYMLPIGTTGFHVTAEIDASETRPERRPSINLIELAESLGYTVVYTEEQMDEVVNGDTLPEKILGVFAADATFDATREEVLGLNTDNPSPLYVATAPTVAEMLEASLKILKNDPDGFFAVLEEEGTDNFGNSNNAPGTIEAMRRADAAIGVAMDYVNTQDPNTLVITAADSDAGGMQVFQFAPYSRPSGNLTSDPNLGDTEPQVPFINVNPTTTNDTPNYLDGATGSTGSEEFPWDAFPAMDSIDGPMGNFGIAWAGTPDFPGSIVAKTYGMNAELLSSTIDNTEIYDIMYQTLFGVNPDSIATLVGFSSLPADTFLPGLPGGSGFSINSDNREVPFAEQPVQGFSGVQFAEDGNYWFLSDNGYGSKANSDDYLLRIFKVDPNFQTEDGGNGEAEVLDFIQLSDPNNFIPFDIVSEGTTERFLTGADFDVESIVVTDDRIWIGEEFGPYLLEFNLDGELLSAPIATPNIYNFNTLNGEDPLVIAHRGASGDRPEHTLGFLGRDLIAAYNLGIEFGADYIEPDLVPTKDGVLIARHENALAVVETDANGNPLFDENGEYVIDRSSTSTNVYLLPQFSDRLTTKVIDGTSFTGWFSEDFTLEEIKQLRAVERIPDIRPENTEYDFFFEIPTLEEIIDLVNEIEATTGEQIGIYPETKHPTFFATEGTFIDGSPININTSQILIDTLVEKGFTDPDRIFIQSFEVSNLQELSETIMPEAGVDIPLVQLIGGGGAPYDLVADGDDRTYSDLITPDGLAEIATYADGIGPSKRRIVGTSDNNLLEPTTLVEDAHEAGLQVHPYTFRDEDVFLANDYNGNPEAEYDQFYSLGVDGVFSDNPDTARLVLDKITAAFVSSPDNPENADLVNLSRSRGYEGLGYSPDLMTLYPLLEGRVMGDPENALRIYEFDVASGSFLDELAGYYELEDGSHAIGDMTPINDNEFIIIERDGNQGDAAEFKKLFKVDLSQVDENGFVEKTELVDLLNIADPDDLNNDGDTTFRFPFVTIEDVLVIDEQTILVANDNNYPFSMGREGDIDNNEIIKIQLQEPLDVDPRLGIISEVGLTVDKTSVTENADTYTLTFTLDEAAPEGGLRVVWSEVDSDNAFGDVEFPPTLTNASNLEQLTPEAGELARSAITIDEGATFATITLTTVADEVTEGDETTTYTLIDEIGYAPTAENSVTVTIEDTSVEPIEVPSMVRGSAGADVFDTEDPGDSGFIGDNQLLFAGSGDDFVDVTFAPGGDRSRIDLGSGDDIIFAGSNNRIIAGSGDDILFLGSGEGNNVVTGGSGMDQFWIVTDAEALPTEANTITDFTIGEDVIGFGATDLSFDDLMLTQNGLDTTINALGQDLAILRRIDSTDLSSSDFAFA
ncbi:glycerophosphoryl diester phosphodiesterase [Crocosphaera subtropica ATCC 51142]|uniref:Glycerophosphoryl diester phosphodiesterase n=1 Tax=Crocosphaera subtropica (strain ATCC 51142 / BH68) TaxID=43989 RepID=B1WZU3_CROS5|nr:glycerophosphoryl diester phosphodiesterase [Crocosphaera subtropica ATCC 51142]